jgi:hypothetical protein
MQSLQTLSGCRLCKKEFTGAAEEKGGSKRTAESEGKGRTNISDVGSVGLLGPFNPYSQFIKLVWFTDIRSRAILSFKLSRCIDGQCPGRLRSHTG